MSYLSSNLTCFVNGGHRTDLVSELGLDFSGPEWNSVAYKATDIQMTKWFGRILSMPGMSSYKPFLVGPCEIHDLSEQECDAFGDPKTFKKLCRLTKEVDAVQHNAFHELSSTRPPRPKGTQVLPAVLLAVDLALLKHLSEIIEADRLGGEGKSYPMISPYLDLPTQGPLLDHRQIAERSGGTSVPDLCAAAQRELTEHWAAKFSGKTPAQQAVLMAHTEFSRAARVSPFDDRIGDLPRVTEASDFDHTMRHNAEWVLESIASNSARDDAWLLDMSKLAWDLDLMDWEIPGATKGFTRDEAQEILDGHSANGTTGT